MSADPADAAVRDQLGQQASDVTGTPSAGVFGDQAGASQPGQAMDLSAATPAAADPGDLEARIAAQQAQIDALLKAQADAKPAEAEPAAPVDVTPHVGNASGELRQALLWLHKRIAALEESASLNAVESILREL